MHPKATRVVSMSSCLTQGIVAVRNVLDISLQGPIVPKEPSASFSDFGESTQSMRAPGVPTSTSSNSSTRPSPNR